MSAPTVDHLVQDLLGRWDGVLAGSAATRLQLERAARRSLAHSSSLAHELVLAGLTDEKALFRSIADHLRLDFQQRLEPKDLVSAEPQERALLASGLSGSLFRIMRSDGSLANVVADYDLEIDAWTKHFEQYPEQRCHFVIVPPSEARRVLIARANRWLLREAVHQLRLESPRYSAHEIATGWQGWIAGFAAAVLPISLFAAPYSTLLTLNVIGLVAFACCVGLRFMALRSAAPLVLAVPVAPDPNTMPVYSVLVALHREREVIPQLLVALGKLQWPRSRLEIKLVCEADDAETLAALDAHRLHPCIEIIRVPPALPRTKPKALAYALPLCSGELVTLYDAEDRPHPNQLVEAWQRFGQEDQSLACLQAPLVVTNGRSGVIARLFEFEYAALFRGLVPWLASIQTVVPLGGTSNHFRRSALVDVGGWDPYNVTEDADLGLRLRRHGYRIGTLSLPTLEDGPEDLATWLPQRTRWFKGWLLTWLVHMREPRVLMWQLGLSAFIVTQILFLGTFLSALIHPLCVAMLTYYLLQLAGSGDFWSSDGLFALIGSANVILGYVAFILLGASTYSKLRSRRVLQIIIATPLLWLLLSLAAWKALAELLRNPHQWNKTPHKPVQRTVSTEGASREPSTVPR